MSLPLHVTRRHVSVDPIIGDTKFDPLVKVVPPPDISITKASLPLTVFQLPQTNSLSRIAPQAPCSEHLRCTAPRMPSLTFFVLMLICHIPT